MSIMGAVAVQTAAAAAGARVQPGPWESSGVSSLVAAATPPPCGEWKPLRWRNRADAKENEPDGRSE